MTISELLRQTRGSLSLRCGVFAQSQAEEILCSCTHLSRTELHLAGSQPLSPEIIDQINSITARRIKGEPLQYILQTVYFYDREFHVNSSVLIPRPDTEILVETILASEPDTPLRFADIGTGSGIIVGILTEQRRWNGIGVDISISALKTARQNNRSKYSLLCANCFNAFKPIRQFDFIVSNPPYISSAEMQTLDPEVLDYEPSNALWGGDDGLDFYRTFAAQAPAFIKQHGKIYCEIGYNQSVECEYIFKEKGWRDIMIKKDFGGNPRVLSARVPEDRCVSR